MSVGRSRTKRALLTPDCNDNVELLSVAARVALAVFVPGAAAGNALKNLARLACWSEKQSNITTKILGELLLDQKGLRHALLQDRAVIDFLLLAQGHGCEDFDGMCCFNLSDHSKSIHQSIALMKKNLEKMQQDTSPWDKWFEQWGLTGWVKDLFKEGLRLLMLLAVGLIIIIIIVGIVKRLLSKLVSTALLAQKEKGGIVEGWLSENGHDLVPFDSPCS